MTEPSRPFVRQEDIDRMTSALAAFRAAEWWFKTENSGGDSRYLAPLVLQNMRIGYESGSLTPTMAQFENLVKTAIFFQMKCRSLQNELDALSVKERTDRSPE